MNQDKIVKLALDSIMLDQAILLKQKAETNNEERIRNLAESISEIGLQNPIVVVHLQNGSYKLIEGYHRYMACKRLGHKEVNCRVKEAVIFSFVNLLELPEKTSSALASR